MILRILKANHFYNFILIPIIGALLLLRSFLNDGVFPGDLCNFSSPLCNPILQLGISHQTALIIGFLLVLLICFLLFQINIQFAFVKEQTFLPAYIFLFVTYAFPTLQVVNPIFFSAIFIILALRSIFKSFDKKIAIQDSFNAGFFIGLSAIFYFETSMLILIIPSCIFIIKNKIQWREVFVPFIGFLIPWLLLFSGYFILGDVKELTNLLIDTLKPLDKTYFLQPPVLIFLSYIVFLIAISSAFITRQYNIKNISVRRYLKVLFIIFVSTILLQFLPSVSIECLVLTTIPVTFLLTNYLIQAKRKIWAEIFLDLLIVSAFTIQFFF